MNHKWKDDTCINCGIVRQKRSWKLLMAMVGSKDYYKYGRDWYYGRRHKDNKNVVQGLGFKRPDCFQQPIINN